MVYQIEIPEGKNEAETRELDVAWSQTYIWVTKFYLKQLASDELRISTAQSNLLYFN